MVDYSTCNSTSVVNVVDIIHFSKFCKGLKLHCKPLIPLLYYFEYHLWQQNYATAVFFYLHCGSPFRPFRNSSNAFLSVIHKNFNLLATN